MEKVNVMEARLLQIDSIKNSVMAGLSAIHASDAMREMKNLTHKFA